jgi:hypothetical protein
VWSASDGGGPIKCWDSERFKSAKDVNTASFVKGEVVTHMARITADMSTFIFIFISSLFSLLFLFLSAISPPHLLFSVWIGTMSGMIKIWTVGKKKMVHEMKVSTFPIWYMIAQESSSSVWVAHGDGIVLFYLI